MKNKSFRLLFFCSFACCVFVFQPSKSQVVVTKKPSSVTISNRYISRTFLIENHCLRPGVLVNKRIEKTFAPSKGSEEFSLNLLAIRKSTPRDLSAIDSDMEPIDRKTWTAEADSWCCDSKNGGSPASVLDGNKNTIWHTWYQGANGSAAKLNLPHALLISLGRETEFRSFGYVPRDGIGGIYANGNIKGYQFAISDDKKTWTILKKGNFSYVKPGRICWVDLGKKHKARYVKLIEVSSLNGAPYGACAEFYLSKHKAPKLPCASFCASDMRLKDVRVVKIPGGKKVIFEMQPYHYRNPLDGIVSLWGVRMVAEMKNKEHFMRKYLLISAKDENAGNMPIDYIEMEHLGIKSVSPEDYWTHPEGRPGEGGMSAYTLTLGEPYYIDGMFFGSEFPQAENEISDGYAKTRYYSGKTLKELGLNEGRLDSCGEFKTWSNVIGATRSARDLNVVRTDFFQYLSTIIRPARFRMQYNSWYDWMMSITEKRINRSFREMENGFSHSGLRPLDSYVVDDGWNNYGVTSSPEESGSSPNVSGFWEFNSKFPNGLRGASMTAHRLGSNFGIWLGPRGGYNFNAKWGKLLEKHHNGTFNQYSYDAVTGDSVYIQKLKKFFLECQAKYGVNYWKLDGFSTRQPQPSLNGRYITGGKNGNYYFTEHWERWYKVLSALYKEAHERKSNLWLNLTCYVNPSPWILQWCNSVWMQNSKDMGRLVVDGRDRELDKQLSYRDDRYYDFINGDQIQFPLEHLFNHEPIYGKTFCMNPHAMTDSEFRAYLYMIATRGAAFWEMLYSGNMMNEGQKWLINTEALTFAEKNHAVLKHAIYFGKSPKAGEIYGYSCWRRNPETHAEEGIVSFRNPSSETKTCLFEFNNSAGLEKGGGKFFRNLVMDYGGAPNEELCEDRIKELNDNKTFAYGQKMRLSLRPGEIRIYHFGKQDLMPAGLTGVCGNDSNVVTLRFDKPVLPRQAKFFLCRKNHQIAKAAKVDLKADFRTITLRFSEKIDPDVLYSVKIQNLPSWNQLSCDCQSPAFYFNPGNIALSIKSVSQIDEKKRAFPVKEADGASLIRLKGSVHALSPKNAPINSPFTLSLKINTKEKDCVIAHQGGAFSISLKGGCPRVEYGKMVYQSSRVVNTGKSCELVVTHENNGMLKLYIDGKLDGSAYLPKAWTNHSAKDKRICLGENGKVVDVGDVTLWADALSYKQIAQKHAVE